jgi:hypothetical protein
MLSRLAFDLFDVQDSLSSGINSHLLDKFGEIPC